MFIKWYCCVKFKVVKFYEESLDARNKNLVQRLMNHIPIKNSHERNSVKLKSIFNLEEFVLRNTDEKVSFPFTSA